MIPVQDHTRRYWADSSVAVVRTVITGRGLPVHTTYKAFIATLHIHVERNLRPYGNQARRSVKERRLLQWGLVADGFFQVCGYWYRKRGGRVTIRLQPRLGTFVRTAMNLSLLLCIQSRGYGAIILKQGSQQFSRVAD